MASGSLACLMFTLIALNILTAAAGLALMAVAIWVVVDGYKLYPISAASGKDDIFAAAWIAIFTGFAFFLMSLYGIIAVRRRSRVYVLVYIILMFIIFLFESASAITAATHRDYLVGNSNLVKKQMLQFYADSSAKGKQITNTWNKVMQDVECCGVDSPNDWIAFSSTYTSLYGYTYPYPPNCCKKKTNGDVESPEDCKIGRVTALFSKGCFKHIENVLSHYTWAISWYGFAVLMLVFFTLVIAMVYYIQLD